MGCSRLGVYYFRDDVVASRWRCPDPSKPLSDMFFLDKSKVLRICPNVPEFYFRILWTSPDKNVINKVRNVKLKTCKLRNGTGYERNRSRIFLGSLHSGCGNRPPTSVEQVGVVLVLYERKKLASK